MMIARIMPGLVVTAYARTGLRPARGVWLETDGKACALVAVAMMANRVNPALLAGKDPEVQEMLVMRHLADPGSYSYLVGFTAGFDGVRSPAFYLGMQDGEAAWRATQEAEL